MGLLSGGIELGNKIIFEEIDWHDVTCTVWLGSQKGRLRPR